MSKQADVAVIGGGVVGLCCALFSARRGLSVVVIDRARDREAASTGNAGMIVPSHIIPLSAPGVIAQGLKWLVRSDSPFYIKPRPDPRLIRWLWIFRKHCTDDHVAHAVPLLRDLSLESRRLFDELCSQPLYSETGFRSDGLLMVHRSDKSAYANAELANYAERAGLDISTMDAERARLAAGVVPEGITGGVLFRQDAHIHPEQFLKVLELDCERNGVSFLRGTEVTGFQTAGSSVVRAATGIAPVAARQFVLAAGAWSARLLRPLGFKLPLQPAKGYSITLSKCSRRPRIPIILTDDKVTITPFSDSIRFGGTLALSGFDTSRDQPRIRRIMKAASYYCPDVQDTPMADVWAGFRPASPDGLPFIGRLPNLTNVLVATGHGMMGVSLAPITGRMIESMLVGDVPNIDPLPFNPARFD